MKAADPIRVLGLLWAAIVATPLAATPAATPATPVPPAAGAPAAPAAASAANATDRLQVYHDFRALFDAHNYADARPLAERLVTLSETAAGADDLSVATPLINLATTQYQLGEYAAAETSYLRSIKIIEQHVGGFSKPLIAPLHGLGLTYMAANQTDAAIDPLRRAVDISRKIDGLFNAGQLEVLNPLIRCYTQTGQMDDAEREVLYSNRLAESLYGAGTVEVTPTIEKVAQWYSDTGRNTTARRYYAQALAILQKAKGDNDLLLIPPLRGYASTLRLEYLYGPEQTEITPPPSAALGATLGTAPTGNADFNPANARLDPNGEAALRNALRIAVKDPHAEPALRAAILIDLGDWFTLSSQKKEALDAYREAWPLVKDLPPPQNAVLSQPAQLLYRTPLVGIKSHRAKPENIIEGYVDLEFTVSSDGRVTGEHVVGKNATDDQEHAVLSAIKKAHYRPRFDQGQPAETPGVRFHQPVFSVKAGKAAT
jgi:TonB family protein